MEDERSFSPSFSPRKPKRLAAWPWSALLWKMGSWDGAGAGETLTPKPEGRGVSSPWLSERRVRSGVRIRNVLSCEVRRPRADRPAIRSSASRCRRRRRGRCPRAQSAPVAKSGANPNPRTRYVIGRTAHRLRLTTPSTKHTESSISLAQAFCEKDWRGNARIPPLQQPKISSQAHSSASAVARFRWTPDVHMLVLSSCCSPVAHGIPHIPTSYRRTSSKLQSVGVISDSILERTALVTGLTPMRA